MVLIVCEEAFYASVTSVAACVEEVEVFVLIVCYVVY
jgi:hypothetical protein